MTFKHTKFEDSPIMRSLEKVAKEKGLVKEEPVVKQAEKKQNLSASHNFTSNILKLCEGLRSAGLNKAAAEVETKFLNYKQAQTMYDTHGEKGEDLVHAAHPKGSHKLEGVEGDEATFEDILDKHMKILQVIEKKPSGKLASVFAIGEVKKALGQDKQPKESESQLYAQQNQILGEMPVKFGNILARVIKFGSWWSGESPWASNIDENKAKYLGQKVYAEMSPRPFGRENLQKLIKAFSDFTSWASDTAAFERSAFNSSDHDEKATANWNTNVGPYASDFSSLIRKLQTILSKLETITYMKQTGTYKDPVPEGQGTGTAQLGEIQVVADPIIGTCVELINKLNAFKSIGVVSRNQMAINWIGGEVAQLQDIIKRFNAANDTGQVESVRGQLNQEVSQKKLEVDDFYTKVTQAQQKKS
jgi:hypothetical protein